MSDWKKVLNGSTTKSRLFERQKERKMLRRKQRNKILLIIALVLGLIWVCIFLAKEGVLLGGKYKYPVAYSSYITRYSRENELDPYLVISVIKQESNFIADARSPYAGGLMQLTEVTAKEYASKLGLTDYNYMDPETNIKIGCFVLSSLIDKYGVIDTALAAYNAGVGNVDSWLENPDYSTDGKTLYKIPFPETKHYVEKINKYIYGYKNRVTIE